jgi:hypothetical protein
MKLKMNGSEIEHYASLRHSRQFNIDDSRKRTIDAMCSSSGPPNAEGALIEREENQPSPTDEVAAAQTVKDATFRG